MYDMPFSRDTKLKPTLRLKKNLRINKNGSTKE